MDDEEDKYRRYANLPIPTYDEATSSRPTSSHDFRGPQEVSDDAERQGLLGRPAADAHRVPTVESARSSEESNLELPEVVVGDGDSDRRHIEELDYLDPSDDASPTRRRLYHRARLRQFSKHLANLSATFSSLRLPSFRSLYSPVANGESSATESPPPRRTWLPRPRFGSAFHIPDHYKMSAPIFARLFGLFTIAAVIYILFAFDMFPGTRPRIGRTYDPERVRIFVQSNVEADNIRDYLQHITSYDHVAGTEGDFYLASWMQEKWVEWGGFDDVALLDNFVYLNYPTHEGRSVKIVEPEGKRWTAQLEENLVDPSKQQTLAWHGHSKGGDATGHLIYANGGSREDFQWLKDNGVETEGAIALVRYYARQDDPALKIKAAEEAGCAGVLIYSDPSNDGSGKGEVWPDGPWRPEDSVQRGGVSLVSWIVGDPLTPGWPSLEQAKTITKESSPGLPQIPSLPLPWRDAKVLIDALKGQGVEVPNRWTGGTGNDGKWFSGAKDSNRAPIVELRNRNDENEKQQIWNVHGLIQGIEQPKKKIIVGSHHDAWCFGSVDAGSASAVMMEVVSIFAELRLAGWRPLRSIQFASWDASQYSLIGSTEYVEDQIDYLRENGIAYINVDVGVYGQNFRAAASPLFRRALRHVLGRVSDPTTNATLRRLWNQNDQKLEGLGSRSDYVAFQDMAGMSSIDFGFEGPKHGYPRHSCYETFEWMAEFGDPGFEYHRKLAQVWALLILEIADRPLIPFDLGHYASEIQEYVKKLQEDALEMYRKQNPGTRVNEKLLQDNEGFDLTPLREAAENVRQNVRTFHHFEDTWTQTFRGAGGREYAEISLQRLEYNDKQTRFETDLLDIPTGDNDKDQHGIPGREQYKHIIFGPQLWSGYEEAYFPAVRDAMEDGDWERAQKMVEKAAKILDRAGKRLVE